MNMNNNNPTPGRSPTRQRHPPSQSQSQSQAQMHQAQLHAFHGLYAAWFERQLTLPTSQPSTSALPPPPPPGPPPASLFMAAPFTDGAQDALSPPVRPDFDDHNEAEPFVVPAIFQSPTADLVLISLEQIEFRVHRLFLVQGSTFFRRMFEDACPDTDYYASASTSTLKPAHTQSQTEVERIPWPEPARTISLLLSYIYPVPKPHIANLDTLLSLLHSADKWEVPAALSLLKTALLAPEFLHTRPLRIYGFLCTFPLSTPAELEHVVRACLERADPRDALQRGDLRGMTAEDFARLLDLRDSRATLAQGVVEKGVSTACPHGFPWSTAGMIQRWKALVCQRLQRTPVGSVLEGGALMAEIMYPEGVSSSCRLCIPAEARRTCIDKLAKVRKDIDALAVAL